MMIPQPRRRALAPPGLTLIEATISIVLVGVLLTGALQTVGISRKGQKIMSDRARGQQLALDLMNEIMTQAYSTPGATVLGLDLGKLNSNRSQFSDVDDYSGWTESPPADRSGNALSGMTGWRRSVTVEWADPVTLAPTNQADSGLKLVTVTSTNRGASGGPVATIKAYRSVAWIDTIPASSDALSNHSPVAVISATPTTAITKLDTTLSGLSSTDADGNTLTYSWTFGDGTVGAGATVTHTYGTVGTYTATLTVYDGKGGLGSASVVLTVTP